MTRGLRAVAPLAPPAAAQDTTTITWWQLAEYGSLRSPLRARWITVAAVGRNHGNVIQHMRGFLIALCACGTAGSNAPQAAEPTAIARKPRLESNAPIDVIDALSQPLAESSWIAPGPAQLVLGGTSVQANDGAPRLEVSVLEEQGSDVRVGVRLEHARFALWMARSRLLAIVARDQHVMLPGAPIATGNAAVQVLLHRGAQVQRLAKRSGTTQVRYVGALELEGWLPDEAISDRAPAGHTPAGRIATGRKTVMLRPGTIIRAEPTWSGQQLAVMNQGYFVDLVKEVDDAWTEITYEDGDLAVHGFVSRRDPPGRTHRKPAGEPTTALAPNATVRDGTCLYAGGEPVGFIVGERQVVVEKTHRTGWYALTIDTPWSAIAFEAKGATEVELATCGS